MKWWQYFFTMPGLVTRNWIDQYLLQEYPGFEQATAIHYLVNHKAIPPEQLDEVLKNWTPDSVQSLTAMSTGYSWFVFISGSPDSRRTRKNIFKNWV